MSERAPTLAQLRAEARRVHGPDADVHQDVGWTRVAMTSPSWLKPFYFQERSTYADARRFALETLRQLPSKETP